MTISAVIITCNEERNIGRCLDSLQDLVDEVVVVDSGSHDGTESICLAQGVRFVRHEWEGYSEQKNFANGLASQEWILSLDADEALSPALRTSLMQLRNHPPEGHVAFRFHRLTNYCGHFVRYCGWYPDSKIRLWRSGSARWEGRVHEILAFEAEPHVVTLDGDLLHYSYYSISEHAERQNRYSLLAAEKAYEGGRRCGLSAVVLKPVWTFLRDYLLRLGFLDVATGLIICRFNAHYTFMKYARLRELCRTQNG